MSSSKRRRRHTCKHHSRALAKGKCSGCGSWICPQCATSGKGPLLCVSCAQARQPEEVPSASTHDGIPAEQVLVSRRLTTLAAVTLFICLLVIVLWQARTNRRLTEQNQRLRETRIELLSAIRRGNQEIAALQDRLPQLPPPTEQAAPARITPRQPDARPAPLLAAQPVPATLAGLPHTFTRGLVKRPLVCLTFDGGSHANAAEAILDTLLSRNVKATIFLTGEFIRRHSPVVRRIVADGHEVGNHTLRHPHLTTWEQDRTHTTLPGIDAQRIHDELHRANNAFRTVAGRDFAPLWRAPYGEINRQIGAWAQRHGYLHIGWTQGRTWRDNLDSNDWTEDENTAGYRSPREVFAKMVTFASSKPDGINGGIILMHLGTVRKDPREQVHLILGSLIDRLREMGYQFVMVSEMLRESGIDPGVVRSAQGTAAVTMQADTPAAFLP